MMTCERPQSSFRKQPCSPKPKRVDAVARLLGQEKLPSSERMWGCPFSRERLRNASSLETRKAEKA